MCTTWETTWAKWRANRRPGCQVRYIDTCMQPTLCCRQMRECGSGRVLQYLSYPNAPGGHDGAKRQLAGNQGAPFPFPPSEEGWIWRDGRYGIEDQATGCTAQLLGSWAPRLLGWLLVVDRPVPPRTSSFPLWSLFTAATCRGKMAKHLGEKHLGGLDMAME